jgi:RHS repeat-associated protein
MTAPANNAVFAAGASIALNATAADSDGTVAQVEFYDGATLFGTATAAPYGATLASVPAGSHTLTAVATDNLGASTTSAALSVTVDSPPAVSLGAPANDAVFAAPASVTLSASATDAVGRIVKVDFYQGATLIGTASASPYSFAWTSVAAGQYSLTAVVTNDAGQTATSAAIAITVRSAVAQIYYIHADHLNTPRLIADAQQRVVWRWDQQEPFGNNVPDENPSGLGAFEFPMRFPGQYADKETNLAYNFWRDYDPLIGRYVQSDIVGLASGLNPYVYANADPIAYFDREGLYPQRDNGNRKPGHTQQDMVCTLPGPLGKAANANRCIKKCCIAHDNCYTQYKCNESSWRGKFWTQCMQCNFEAVLCIANALTKSRQTCGVCDD